MSSEIAVIQNAFAATADDCGVGAVVLDGGRGGRVNLNADCRADRDAVKFEAAASLHFHARDAAGDRVIEEAVVRAGIGHTR